MKPQARPSTQDSDENEDSSSASSDEEIPQPPAKKRKSPPPIRSPPPKKENPEELRKSNKPEMRVVSSAARVSTALSHAEDTFESLLAQQKDQQRSAPMKPELRPTGDLQMSWKLESKKKPQSSKEEKGRKLNGERRSASKNVFRKMKS